LLKTVLSLKACPTTVFDFTECAITLNYFSFVLINQIHDLDVNKTILSWDWSIVHIILITKTVNREGKHLYVLLFY